HDESAMVLLDHDAAGVVNRGHQAPARPARSGDPGTHHGGDDLITAAQPIYPTLSKAPRSRLSVAACLSSRTISASTAAASVGAEASPPSFRNSCFRCCSVSEDTFPILCSVWRLATKFLAMVIFRPWGNGLPTSFSPRATDRTALNQDGLFQSRGDLPAGLDFPRLVPRRLDKLADRLARIRPGQFIGDPGPILIISRHCKQPSFF